MNTRLFPSAIVALLAVGSHAAALQVEEGADITEVRKAMSAAGYAVSGLAMRARDEGHQLEFWSVGDGVLIANYVAESKKLVALTYWLADERPKLTRKTFTMEVKSFDTETGIMSVQAGKTKREQGVGGQPATTPRVGD